MLGYDDVAAAAAGEERDALFRAMAQDAAEAAALRRPGTAPGFVRAERPADVARALGRDRRIRRPQAASWSAAS